MKKKEQKNKECPLCEVSQETLGKLKEESKERPLKKSNKKKKKILPKIFILIIILTLAGFVSYKFFSNFSSRNQRAEEEVFEEAEIGALAPGFTLEDTSGNKISLSDFRNKKPVLLVFWATWCKVCDDELPYLKDFYEVNKEEVEVFAIFGGEAKWAVKDYVKKHDIKFPALLDNKRTVWKKYLVRGTPAHFLINMDGKIIASIPGFATNFDLKMMFYSPFPQ